MTPTRPSSRDTLVGIASIAVMILIVRLCIGMFTQEFETAASIDVRSDRAGLLLETNAAVTYRGVSVGRVSRIVVRHDGADVTLALNPNELRSIPENVTAAIVPTTLLGSKFIELRDPREPATARLSAGTVISTVHTTAELNQTFDSLVHLLTALKPAAVSDVLHSLSAALDGNGQSVRAVLDDLGTVLPAVNARGNQINTVLEEAAPVLRGYTDLTNPLVNTMVNAGELSTFLESRSTEFAQLLVSLTAAGYDVGAALATLEPGLGVTARTLRPTLELLARYSDEIPCLLQGEVEFGKRARAVFGGPANGGTHRNGHVTLSLERSQPAYEFPKNLPKVGAKGGPNCHGLPLPGGIPPFTAYDVGANPYPQVSDQSSLPDKPLGLWLFGSQLGTGGKR